MIYIYEETSAVYKHSHRTAPSLLRSTTTLGHPHSLHLVIQGCPHILIILQSLVTVDKRLCSVLNSAQHWQVSILSAHVGSGAPDLTVAHVSRGGSALKENTRRRRCGGSSVGSSPEHSLPVQSCLRLELCLTSLSAPSLE
jgi:hypothetical protein